MGGDPGAGADAVRWNLDPIYQGPNDPQIARDEVEIDRLVDAFQAHRGPLEKAAPTGEAVAEAINDFEQIRFRSDRLVTYASLGASADQEDEALSSLYARLEERQRRWSSRTVFAELALRRLPKNVLRRLAESPALVKYRHFIEYQAAMAPHTLSESEEQVALKKNIAGRDATVRFREEFAARLDFGSLTIDGETRPMNFAGLISLHEHPNPEVRLEARNRLNETFAAQKPIFSFLFGNVVKDHAIEAELRSYQTAIDVENIPNEIPGDVVQNLIATSRKYLPVLHDYYRWKAKMLGVGRLRTCDVPAPLPGADPDPIPWERAREFVEGAFTRLDADLAQEIRLFFDEKRLDAAPRIGKRGGAFCAAVPGHKPYILLSYTGTLATLITLAHELGHGIHFLLSGGKQTYLQAYDMSKVAAETASEFAECLLRDHMLETEIEPALRRKILVSEVDRLIGIVFRQLFYTEYEIAVHEQAAKGPLSPDQMSELWVRLAGDHFGPRVDLLDSDAAGWSIIGHFVFNPFYCYSYALSQVVVLALYRKWKRDGASFVPRYLELLRGGWSATPEELLKTAGIDLRDPGVMEEAFKEFEERVRSVQEAFS